METNSLLAGIETHVVKLFTALTKPYLIYHNFTHTRQVVKHAGEIAAYYSLDEEALFVLLAAAWFHDTGQLTGEMYIHEEAGVELMQSFLVSKGVEENIRAMIAKTILATKMPVDPVNLVEKILCDADTWHLGTPDFRAMDALVWQELELRLNKTFDHKAERTLHFLEMHTYHTSYCQQLLDEGKRRNKEQLQSEINP